ncbi:hypothetical protein NQ318_010766 [Aromia moschata]|uniref:DDE-1 domain-containing protein n=1 Tax=Aromia moschata TaxID=1265417 RepID=A0AAV8YXJ7_9CUCU|nr:hypothetical protein NQ318_010766 [Aromia moschata]
MVKPRLKKTNRGEIPQELYERAANVVITENAKVRTIARQYGMRHVSLRRFVIAKKNNKNPQVGYHPHNKVFTFEQERELVDYCTTSSKLYFELSPKDLRKLAYQFVQKNGCTFPTGWKELQMASEDWLTAFLKRNPSLSIRTPESTSSARAMNFNRENVSKFFDNLAGVLERYSYQPKNIYNIDETGCTTVQKPNKIIARKGVKQVGAITSQERGTLVRVCVAINALGNSVPPMFIFPLQIYNEHFVRDGPPGCIGTGNKSGWTQEETFLIFIKHFANYAKPTPTDPVLVTLDNHCSHLSVPVIDFCKENNITLLTFPPHTSHKLEPLDRGVFGPFKKFFNNECDQWMKMNPGKRMTIYNLQALVKEALPLALTPKNITGVFRCSGIWPLNRNIFTEDEFAPSNVTDRPIETFENLVEAENLVQTVDPSRPSTSRDPLTPPRPSNAKNVNASSARTSYENCICTRTNSALAKS